MKAKIIPRIFNTPKSKLEEHVPLDTPYSVHIDICSICNFKCNFCFQSDPDAMKKKGYKYGSMSFELFKKITDDLAEFKHKIRKVKIGLHGEPTLHPELPKMIKYLKSKNVTGIIELFTNGSLLNPKLNRELIAAGLDQVNMSIEGLTAEKYREVTGAALDMEKFVENIRDLYNNRKDCKIYIKIVDINLTKEDKDKFYDTFGDICDEIFIEMSCRNGMKSTNLMWILPECTGRRLTGIRRFARFLLCTCILILTGQPAPAPWTGVNRS